MIIIVILLIYFKGVVVSVGIVDIILIVYWGYVNFIGILFILLLVLIFGIIVDY